jgi:hypothetical protein
MEWQIAYLEDEQVVVVETSGVLDEAASLDMARAGLAAVRQRRWRRVLMDHRRITGFTLSTVDIYDRGGQLRALGLGPEIRIAEVVPKAFAEDFNFLGTVSANRGIRMTVFLDREAALHWLLEE